MIDIFYKNNMTLEKKKLKKILRIPIYLTLLLIMAKYFIYKSSGSLAIFSLFTDSFFDFVGSFISLIAYKYSLKNKTEKYQYGFYGIIDLATIIISVLVLITTFFIYKHAITNILYKNTLEYDAPTILVLLLSTIVSLVLVYFLKIVYDKTKLLVIKGEIAHYEADGFTNGGVLLSVIVCKFIHNHYLVDPVIAMIIGYLVAKPAIEVMTEALNNILSKEIDSEIKEKIIETLKLEKDIVGYHNFKTRKSGERVFIQIYLEINKDLTFEKAHAIVEKMEDLIENKIENSEIIIHACPK